MKKPIIIGIAGFAKAGKSTFAARLVDHLARRHLGAEIVPFAQPLKRGLSCMGIDKDAEPELYRCAAQFIGTDIVRKRRPDHWVDRFKDYAANATRVLKVERTQPDETVSFCGVDLPVHNNVCGGGGTKITYRDIIIADDVRFANEVDAVRSLGGIMVYVDAADRLGLVKRRPFGFGYRLKRTGIWRHESEDMAAQWWKEPKAPLSWTHRETGELLEASFTICEAQRRMVDVWVNGNMPMEGDSESWADAWIASGIAGVDREICRRMR